VLSVQNPSTSDTRVLCANGSRNEVWELAPLLMASLNHQPLVQMIGEDERTSILKPFHALSKSFFLSPSSRRSTIMLTKVAEASKFWSKTFQIDDIKSRAVDSELR